MSHRANGDGTIFQRQDGRWSAQAYITLTNGERKRTCITSKKREDVKAKLAEILLQEKRKMPFAEKRWTVEGYLDYWLENTVKKNKRPHTYNAYENICRLYLKPELGNKKLDVLSVKDVQNVIDRLHRNEIGTRTLLKLKQTLSSALSQAMREELIFRNVARLVVTPQYQRKVITPWTSSQVQKFLEITVGHELHIAFVLLFNYGMRIGEVLGLRWTDINFEQEIISIRQQLQLINGKMGAYDVKTDSGRRELPLIPTVKEALLEKATMGKIDTLNCYNPNAQLDLQNLVTTTGDGNAVNPFRIRDVFAHFIKRRTYRG